MNYEESARKSLVGLIKELEVRLDNAKKALAALENHNPDGVRLEEAIAPVGADEISHNLKPIDQMTFQQKRYGRVWTRSKMSSLLSESESGKASIKYLAQTIYYNSEKKKKKLIHVIRYGGKNKHTFYFIGEECFTKNADGKLELLQEYLPLPHELDGLTEDQKRNPEII